LAIVARISVTSGDAAPPGFEKEKRMATPVGGWVGIKWIAVMVHCMLKTRGTVEKGSTDLRLIAAVEIKDREMACNGIENWLHLVIQGALC
jgi:hypothetical protein